MVKKKLTSWGVSLIGLSLIACMISYLGYINNETSNKVNIAKYQQPQIINDKNENSINHAYNNDGTLTILSDRNLELKQSFTDDGQ